MYRYAYFSLKFLQETHTILLLFEHTHTASYMEHGWAIENTHKWYWYLSLAFFSHLTGKKMNIRTFFDQAVSEETGEDGGRQGTTAQQDPRQHCQLCLLCLGKGFKEEEKLWVKQKKPCL